MLDVPALAFIVWSLYATARFVETRRTGFLYGLAALVLGALYMKINAGYVGIVIAIVLFRAFGVGLLRNRHVWIAAALFVVGSIPIAVMQLYFGSFNVASAVGQGDVRLHPFNKLDSWLYYIQALPVELGWVPTLATALAGFAYIVALPDRRAQLRRLALPITWLVVAFVIFGFISLKETRHAITFLFPLLIFAGVGIERALGRFGPPVAALFGAGVVAATIVMFPAPAIQGYQEAADFVATAAPKDSLIMFSGIHDGAFIFDLRTHEDRRDLAVWRADKLLVDVVIMRSHGLREAGLDEDAIRRHIREAGVSYLVVQDGFWNDLAVMRRFESVLHGPEFEVVKQVPLTGTTNGDEKMLTVYHVVGPIPPRSKEMLNSPSMGKSGSGKP